MEPKPTALRAVRIEVAVPAACPLRRPWWVARGHVRSGHVWSDQRDRLVVIPSNGLPREFLNRVTGLGSTRRLQDHAVSMPCEVDRQ